MTGATDKRDIDPFSRQRGSSLLAGQSRPPHLRVVDKGRVVEWPIPCYGGGPGNVPIPVVWIRHPEYPRSQPVLVFAGLDDAEPMYTLARPRRGSRATEVRRRDGSVAAVVKAHRLRSAVHTYWSVENDRGSSLFSLSERGRDALWRRSLGMPSRLEGDGFVLAIPGFLASVFRGPNQMRLRDGTGGAIGTVSFSPGIFSPREDFAIYLDNQPFPLTDILLAACVLAAMQRTY
ncbi:hypothetical protein [Williamsia deligens]|uniref:Scramblase n=1 Tax=Williamsia deligens TaxID=321325 RepID=A0ABW3GCR6_9NOCA|nr:hypothetical protein [Williamsia deligens]